MIHHERKLRRPRVGRIFKGFLATWGLAALVATTVWTVQAEVPRYRGSSEDLRNSSLTPGSTRPGPAATVEPGPVVYERGLAPLFPGWSHASDRPAFITAEHLPTVNGVLDLRRPLPGSLARDLSRGFGPRGATLIVTVEGERGEGLAEALLAGGGRLLAPYGAHAWLVQVPGAGLARSLALRPGVTNVLPYSSELIVDRRIGQVPVLSHQEASRADLPLRAGVLSGFDAEAVAADLAALGAKVVLA